MRSQRAACTKKRAKPPKCTRHASAAMIIACLKTDQNCTVSGKRRLPSFANGGSKAR